ncbi:MULTISPECIES: patatin-like phospholipase family protein [Thermus]|uniref:Patatin-like phospholipase family protein n=1 Tax=Thermus brevis TaxID=2862456 RepID=A0ABS7A056_9DEIN|nr:patatin-like phospholipase family protein [Thermus antranikianii]MBW6395679.1 patatin-like phospholipase family protein [Thermus brevis]QWK22249.1 MAG: patatin-like phospholipase family protein [Thermus antranikianii]
MRGLALSGGGARGLAHIGALEVFLEAGLDFQVVAGTSMGAIVGALFAAGKTPEEMLALARRTPWLGLLGFSPREGIFSRRKLLDFLAEHLPKSFDGLKKPLAVTAVDVVSGRLLFLTQGDLPSAVLASAAYPGLLAPVEREGQLLFDGGVLDNLPVDAARFLGATEVWAVDVTPGREVMGAPKGLLALARRAVDLMQLHLTSVRLTLYAPEVYVRPHLAGVGIEDFRRLEEIVEAGRKAARQAIGGRVGGV